MSSNTPSLELDEVQAQLAAVEQKLARLGHTLEAAEHREAMRQLRRRFEHRLDILTRAYQAAMTLAQLSSPSELLLRTPSTLGKGAGFNRVLVSTIDGDTLLPVAAHFSSSDDPEIDADLVADALTRLRESPVRLTHNLVESDVIRRGRASLVAVTDGNPRAAARISQTIGWAAYVVAPIASGATVLGLIHADRGPTTALDVLDRDAIGEFASVVSQLHESAYLKRALTQERDAVRRFIDRLNALSISLADEPITLSGHVEQAKPLLSPISAAEFSGHGVDDDRLVLSGLLTKRELEVLRLLADGGTNRIIADALVISETTAKFHVNSILRKLHVANRAEAVARYLTLLGVPAAKRS